MYPIKNDLEKEFVTFTEDYLGIKIEPVPENPNKIKYRGSMGIYILQLKEEHGQLMFQFTHKDMEKSLYDSWTDLLNTARKEFYEKPTD